MRYALSKAAASGIGRSTFQTNLQHSQVPMKINSETAGLSLHGLEFEAGARLKYFKAIRPGDFQNPDIAVSGIETYQIADDEAASSIAFKSGLLWQVSTCLSIKEDVLGQLSEKVERLRHEFHVTQLLKLIGATSLSCANGSKLEASFDIRGLCSTITITHRV